MDANDPQLVECKAKRELEIAKAELELDLLERSDDLRDKRRLQKIIALWPKHATRTTKQAADLGLTALQYVARFGGDKMNAFVAAWNGDTRSAAMDAGYTPGEGQLLRQMPLVRAAIEERRMSDVAAAIVKVCRVQEFWQQIMDNEDLDPRHRLEASKLLAKSQGALDEKVNTVVVPGRQETMTPELKELLDRVQRPR